MIINEIIYFSFFIYNLIYIVTLGFIIVKGIID